METFTNEFESLPVSTLTPSSNGRGVISRTFSPLVFVPLFITVFLSPPPPFTVLFEPFEIINVSLESFPFAVLLLPEIVTLSSSELPS